MTKLKRRAVSAEQKAQRRVDILNSARALFSATNSYDAILMKHIAENIQLTKGTLYLYFKTKEEVFLALYEQELLALNGRLNTAFSLLAVACSVDDAHRALVSSIEGEDTYLRLNSLLHAVLEQNIDFETALAFKTMLREQILMSGRAIENKLVELNPGQGAELLLMMHEIMIGCYHAATPSSCLDEIFERPDMAFMKLHFDTEFPKLLRLVMVSFVVEASR